MADICVMIYVSSAPLASWALIITLTVYCQWEDDMARERSCHLPAHAEAKKGSKSLTVFIPLAASQANLKNCSRQNFQKIETLKNARFYFKTLKNDFYIYAWG